MAKKAKNYKKSMQKKVDYYKGQNRTLYTRWKSAEQKIDDYEKNIAGQVTALTSHYEGIICYLISELGWIGVEEKKVAEWAKDKEYALIAGKNEDEELMWIPHVKDVTE